MCEHFVSLFKAPVDGYLTKSLICPLQRLFFSLQLTTLQFTLQKHELCSSVYLLCAETVLLG